MQATRSLVSVYGRRVETFHFRADPSVAVAGEHIVFLHGWGLTPRTYLPGLRLLAAAGYPVTALTLPGFGGSDALRGARHSLSAIAEHLRHTLDQLTDRGDLPERVHLVGHSFGGGLALRLAATRPTATTSLTLICPAGGSSSAPPSPHRVAAGLVFDAAAPWAARAVIDLGRNLARHPFAVALSGLSAWQSDLIADAHAVSEHGTPTLMSFATSDTVVSRGTFHETVLPHLEVELVPGRHSWLLGQPSRFADKVTGHLAALNSTPVDIPAA